MDFAAEQFASFSCVLSLELDAFLATCAQLVNSYNSCSYTALAGLLRRWTGGPLRSCQGAWPERPGAQRGERLGRVEGTQQADDHEEQGRAAQRQGRRPVSVIHLPDLRLSRK